jgi:hypothetical protein
VHSIIPRQCFQISILGFLMLFGFGETGQAESEPAAIIQKSVPDSMMYRHGKAAFRGNTSYHGAFFTGFATGLTLPFVVGGSAALAYKSSDDIGLCGLMAGVSTFALWTWAGSRLAYRGEIRAPETLRAGLTDPEWKEFESGYIYSAGEKRRSKYILGVTVGTLIPVSVAMYGFWMLAQAMGDMD